MASLVDKSGFIRSVVDLFYPFGVGSSSAPIRILIVEDDVTQSEVYHRVIARAGVRVETAATVREAVSKIPQFDILILDWRLSDKTEGLNAQIILDAWNDQKIDAPVGIISAYLTQEIKMSLLTQGAYNTLEKPIDLQAFSRVAQRYVHIVKQDRQLKEAQLEIQQFRRTMLAMMLIILMTLIGSNWPQFHNIIQAIFG